MRYRRALKAPLVTRGTLTWSGGFAFERIVEAPYRETSRLDGRMLSVRRERGAERLIPLARAPELEALFAGLSAVFAGDAAALQRVFEIDVEGDARWRLRLTPRDARLRERIDALELIGEGEIARCLLLRQRDAPTLTVFGAGQAPAPAADFQLLVRQSCPMP